MACHIQPLKKQKKQLEMPLPILSPIHPQNVEICGWDGTEDW